MSKRDEMQFEHAFVRELCGKVQKESLSGIVIIEHDGGKSILLSGSVIEIASILCCAMESTPELLRAVELANKLIPVVKLRAKLTQEGVIDEQN